MIDRDACLGDLEAVHVKRSPALLLCLLAACSDGSSTQTTARSDMVAGSYLATSSGPALSSEPKTREGKLCEGRPLAQGARIDTSIKMSLVEADKDASPAPELPLGNGKWTWINLWAGWCEPCLKEIPILKSWEKKLASRMRVVFVSIDDDARKAQRFLKSQPNDGVRSSFHLPELAPREAWMSALGSTRARLPVQILVDPAGDVRCVADGAIVDKDFAEIEKLVSQK